MNAHKQLHVERGALYNCEQCTFNVSKSRVLYHHYRYGHAIEEPELRYPEESVIRAGHQKMVVKNGADTTPPQEDKSCGTAADDPNDGPPMVWCYSKDHIGPAFIKVFKCRFCPHTNRRRHNTVEHERMHSDHPEHKNHRLQQQRIAGGGLGSPLPSPGSPIVAAMHPCKRCSYVCNNAGVLASHAKVHLGSYMAVAVGFYDTSIVDSMQIQALEYVMELENKLVLDSDNSQPHHRYNSNGSTSRKETDNVNELDNPELKFCPYCPARFFLRSDLQCHMRFHKFRAGHHPCVYCSFIARTAGHLDMHAIVHRDEYAQRTAELFESGYPVNPDYGRPSEYPSLLDNDSSTTTNTADNSQKQLSKRETVVVAKTLSSSQPQPPPQEPKTEPESEPEPESESNPEPKLEPEPEPDPKLEPEPEPEHEPEPAGNGQRRQRRTKRPRHSEPDLPSSQSPPQPLVHEHSEISNKRQRRSKSIAATDPVETTDTTASVVTKPAVDATTIKPPNNVDKTSRTGTYVKQFVCHKCPGHFFKASALNYHLTLHGGTGQHHCRKCDYAVSTYGNLIRHESVHDDLTPRSKVKMNALKTPSKPKENDSNSGEDSVSSQTSLPLNVAATGDSTVNDDDYDSDGDGDGDDDDNDYDDSPLATTKNEDDLTVDPEFGPAMLGNPDFYYPTTVKNGVSLPKRYKCHKCPSAFDKRDQYALHLTLHGAQDKYQCDKCDYSVRYTANYVQHQRKHARDIEMRKQHEQQQQLAAGQQQAPKPETDDEEEEAARESQRRGKPPATSTGGGGDGGSRRRRPEEEQQETAMDLRPRDTVFRNEISDRQTAYELNAAYGATGLIGVAGSDDASALLRCSYCPFECRLTAQMDRHLMHHQENKPGGGVLSSKRVWKRSCRFCSYRTNGETDYAEHTGVHFTRSTGTVLASIVAAMAGPASIAAAAAAATAAAANASRQKTDYTNNHVEYHGKRVVNNRRRKRRRSKRDDGSGNCVEDSNPSDGETDDNEESGAFDEEEEEQPFLVFRDRGPSSANNDGKTAAKKRFSPDCQSPPVLIDFNDNRTNCNDGAGGNNNNVGATSDKPRPKHTSFIRLIKEGKQVEFADDDKPDVKQPAEEVVASRVSSVGRKKKSKK